MENTKNTIVAVFLMLGVWFLYMSFTQKPVQPVPDPAPVEQAQPAAASVSTAVESATATVSDNQPLITVPERDIEVNTDLYRAVFSNVGARLKSIRLTKYGVTADPESDLVSVVDVNQNRAATLRLQGANGLQLDPEMVYALDVTAPSLELSGTAQDKLVFRTTTRDGLVVEKIFSFDATSYAIGLDVKVSNQATSALRGDLELSLVQPWSEQDKPKESLVFAGAATYIDDSIEKVTADDVKKENPAYGGQAVWTAFENKYFMSALVPLDTYDRITVQDHSGLITNTVTTADLLLEPGQARSFSYLTYFGPRDKTVLEAVGHNLDKAINYGFFDPIASPLMVVLNYFYSLFGNYGVAIILLTVIIKLLFWPLTHKSYASMKAMQKLKPEMDKIKERFKNDRARQGQETMELYKKHRVNPMGGCLPMVIQIPVFFALYRTLYQAIELRHAPFMLWITDLSAPDTLFSDLFHLGFALGPLPLIMGVTMFLQQKMTPSNADPNMARIMLLMPVVFTFLFLGFPSGLVIYWLINNVLTIVQQYYIHRTMS